MLTVSPALLNSWFVSGQGQFAEVYVGQAGGTVVGPSTTWTTQSSPVLGDVQKVSFSNTTNTVYVNTPDLASYVMGAWWLNTAQTQPFPNLPKDQNSIYKITLNTTYPSTTHSIAGNGAIGIAVNGVVLYNAGDAFTYAHATGTEVAPPGGDGLFNRLAEAVEAVTFDTGNGHQPGNGQYHYHENPVALRAQLDDNVDYVGTTNYFPYDPAVYYLTHGQGADGDFRERTTNLHHSPIIGWMFDGYPIYGPYGYADPNDPASAVRRISSSFSLRSITERTTLPGWAAQLSGGKLGATAAATAADGVYTMTPTQQSQYAGPAVSATYPLGRYGEDYAYVSGSGDLDQFNGRWCKTPEFPNGTYAYFATIDAAGAPAFPYLVHRQYYGQKNGSGSVASITEPVTVSFNVATNVAPVVAGPATLSATIGCTVALAGGLLISVSDVDEAAVESVGLSASAGAINLDLTGPLASRVSIASGANHAAAITLSGAVDELNAALATLTYTAPASGTSATLTVQANDGSAANNLSTALVTAITLTDELVFDVAAGQTVTDTTARSGAIKIVKRGTGTLVLNVANTHTGTTTVEAGTLVVAAGDALASSAVTVGTGGTLKVNAGVTMRSPGLTLAGGTLDGTGATLLVNTSTGIAMLAITSGSVTGSPSLTISGNGVVTLPTDRRQTVALTALSIDQAGGGRLDIGKGRIDVAAGGTTEAALRPALLAGRNTPAGGAFNGASGIMTSGGKASTTSQNPVVGYRVFSTGAAIVAWAAFGDVNLDGQVNSTDASLINQGGKFGKGNSTGATWYQGDFNYSGGVNTTDTGLIGSAGLYAKGSYLPVAPAGQVLSASTTTSSSTISLDAWIAFSLDAGSQKKKSLTPALYS